MTRDRACWNLISAAFIADARSRRSACTWATGTTLSDCGVHRLDESWQLESGYWSRHALNSERVAAGMPVLSAGPVKTWQASTNSDVSAVASSYE